MNHRLHQVLGGCALLLASLPLLGQVSTLPAEPLRDAGQSVTGAFEGWFKNPDGSFSLLVGYYNRNLRQELDVPIGPSNAVEPGGPDRGQPSHFQPGRQWGVFTITVPKDFGEGKLTWTLTANGQTTMIPMSLNPLWEVSPFKEDGMGNTPPMLTFETGGSVQGPRAMSTALAATVTAPLALSVKVADDAKTAAGAAAPRTPPATVTWSKYRGPGAVTFANARPPVEKATQKADPGKAAPGAGFTGTASTTATFSEAGEYVLLVVGNDWSGDGGRGFQCCWTTAHVRVSVKP